MKQKKKLTLLNHAEKQLDKIRQIDIDEHNRKQDLEKGDELGLTEYKSPIIEFN